MSATTILLPRRKVEKADDNKSWWVTTQQLDGTWIGDSIIYQHKTSAYARLGRLTEAGK